MFSTFRLLPSISSRLTRNFYRLKHKTICTATNVPDVAAIDGPFTPSNRNRSLKTIEINDKFFELIGRNLDKPYLSSSEFQDSPYPINGIIYYKRLFVYLPCKHSRDPNSPIKNIWFLLNSGCSYTYLSRKALKKLNLFYHNGFSFNMNINDPEYAVPVYCADEYQNINILGTRTLEDLKLSSININWQNSTFKLSRN